MRYWGGFFGWWCSFALEAKVSFVAAGVALVSMNLVTGLTFGIISGMSYYRILAVKVAEK